MKKSSVFTKRDFYFSIVLSCLIGVFVTFLVLSLFLNVYNSDSYFYNFRGLFFSGYNGELDCYEEHILNSLIKKGVVVSPEFYLSQISDFYEMVITIITAFLGVSLVAGFLYVKSMSKIEILDNIHEAFQTSIVANNLTTAVEENIEFYLGEKNFDKINDNIENLEARVRFIERALDKYDYKIE